MRSCAGAERIRFSLNDRHRGWIEPHGQSLLESMGDSNPRPRKVIWHATGGCQRVSEPGSGSPDESAYHAKHDTSDPSFHEWTEHNRPGVRAVQDSGKDTAPSAQLVPSAVKLLSISPLPGPGMDPARAASCNAWDSWSLSSPWLQG